MSASSSKLRYVHRENLELIVESNSVLISTPSYTLISDPIFLQNQFQLGTIVSLFTHQIVLPFEFTITPITVSFLDKKVSIGQIAFNLLSPHGEIGLNFPCLSFEINYGFAPCSLEITGVSGFFSVPLRQIKQLCLSKQTLEIEEIHLFNRDRHVLDIFGVSTDNGKFVRINDILLTYHTLSGLDIFPFLSPLFHKQAPSFVAWLPQIEIDVGRFLLDMILTDSCRLQFETSQMALQNNKVQIPSMKMIWNEMISFTSKQASISIDGDFYRIDFGTLHFHDRKQIRINDYVHECILAWKAVAPFIVKDQSHTETFPVPIIFSASVFDFKFHADPLASSISHANLTSKSVISDSYIREILMRRKATDLPEIDLEKGLLALKRLEFADFRKKFEATPKFKYILHVTFENPSLSFDCRGFTEKIAHIHRVDPTTKQLYPNLQYDTLLAANFEAKATSLKVMYGDIPGPLMDSTNFSFCGPTLLAVAKNPNLYQLPLVIDGKTIMIDKNPCDLKMFTDMVISAEAFMAYYGDAFVQVYQDIVEMGQALIPHTDQSPERKWWDMMRSQFRGQFVFKVKDWEMRYPGTEDYRDLGDFTPIHFCKFNLVWKEGDALLTSEKWVSPRYIKGQPGPMFFEMPNIYWTFKYKWATKGNYKQHFIFPRIDAVDNYADFRASEIIMESTITYSSMDHIYTHYTFDLAHFEWFWKPVFLFMESPQRCQLIEHKYGTPRKSDVEKELLVTFKAMHRHGTLKMISDSIIFRIFDHYPIEGANQIRGSSIDARLSDFTIFFDCDWNGLDIRTDLKIDADEISVNATDLNHYSNQSKSSTIVVLKAVKITTGDQVTVDVDEMQIHMNQLFGQYIGEYRATATEIAAPKSSQRGDIPLFGSIRKARLWVTSMETDLHAMIELEGLAVTKTSIKCDRGLFYTNGRDGQIENASMDIHGISLDFADAYKLRIDTLSADIYSSDFAGVSYLWAECGIEGSFAQLSLSSSKKQDIRVDAKINHFDGKLIDKQTLLARITMEEAMIGVKNATKEREFTFIAGKVLLFDEREQAIFKHVWCPWEEQLPQRGQRKQLHMEVKMNPEENIFNQVEINAEPTVVKYETTFRNAVIAFFQREADIREAKGFSIDRKSRRILPFVTVTSQALPSLNPKGRELFMKTKSKALKVKSVESNTPLFIRYFRLNPVSMKVSYRNPENRVLGEVNNFEGQIHEVIYHELKLPVMEIVEKISFDIAGDMIPQFLRHVVGLKKIDVNADAAMEEWLHSTDEKLSQQDKQRLLLFGSKTVKKK